MGTHTVINQDNGEIISESETPNKWDSKEWVDAVGYAARKPFVPDAFTQSLIQIRKDAEAAPESKQAQADLKNFVNGKI